jgi:type I restriction enzyme S subunit
LAERRQAVAAGVLGTRVRDGGDRLKWFVTETDVRAGARASVLPLMSVSISWGVRRRDEVTDEGSRAEDLSNYKVCSQGDLVINRMRAFQGALGLAPEDGVVSPDYAVLRVDPALDSGWLVAVMRTTSFVAEMTKRVKGIGSAELGNARTPRINVADLCEIRLEVPPRTQQVAERSEVERLLAKIDSLIAETERFIDLSRERRSALITAAVTGDVDVRKAVA